MVLPEVSGFGLLNFSAQFIGDNGIFRIVKGE